MPTFMVSEVACDDDHDATDDCRYQVAWAINPHMQVGSVDHALACKQHADYTRHLVEAGAHLTRVPFVHGAYDSVFAKDPALLLDMQGTPCALLASLRHPERRQERRDRAERLDALGFNVIADEDAPHWEGGDIVMLPNSRGLLLGHGERSTPAAAAWLERHVGVPVTTIELVDPYLYHLDMALTVLPDGTAIVCGSALSGASLAELEQTPGIRDLFVVEREDALAFALNLVAVGNTIISGATTPNVASIISARGYRLTTTPLDQFHLAGGSAACLVATIHPDPHLTDAAPASLEHVAWTSTAPSCVP